MNFKVGDKVWIHDAFEPYEGEAVVSGLDEDRVWYRRKEGPSSYIDLRPKSHDTIRHLNELPKHAPECFGWPGCDSCSDTERPAVVPPAPEFKIGDVVRLDSEHSVLNGLGGVVVSLDDNFVTVDFGAAALKLSEFARECLCGYDELTLLPTAPAPLGDYHARKHDKGKSRMDLIPGEALEGVGEVLEYGARKYAEESWQDVPDAEKRYRGALLRHMAEIKKHGLLSRDPESGKLHIDHAATNAAFLQYFARKESK